MTSNPPAQPRPPPPTSFFSGLSRQHSYPTLPTSRSATSNLNGDFSVYMAPDLDERPAKRRRVSSQGSSPVLHTVGEIVPVESASSAQSPTAKYISADWTNALYGALPSQEADDANPSFVLPLPNPPSALDQLPELVPARIRTSCRYRADVAVPNTPDSLECPSSAPVLESRKPADYFPWVGKHAEDVINESHVKNGYWDRAPHPPERELNTAKAPLYTAFKHRSGLESLSALFSLVLQQKAKTGVLSSVTSFRPPPRVTLTEAKRKSWIADLADGSVPLRRLSRTIPQGVRGTPLLEQCLLHNVPINRAVWFIKCVGANEIRTLKRKGVNPNVTAGVEIRWLRDWTLSIEQFLETILGPCGTERWYESVRYSIQLCTRLYQENLLDRDHFLEWVVKSLTSCTLELLASWLLLSEMFWLDLTRFRKRARNLAGALLSRFRQLSAFSSGTNMLTEKLRRAIRGLTKTRPGSFLMPDSWLQNREALRSCMNLEDADEHRIYDRIAARNDRLLGADIGRDDTTSNNKAVFELLDTTTAPFDIKYLSENLIEACSEYRRLSHLCIEWSTSRFRGGGYRVYLVARLLRRWQRTGVDVDSFLLEHFGQTKDFSSLNLGSYRHLFAELSRSETFSKSRFMQTLSVQGSDQMNPQSCVFLLRDLCLADAEDHTVNFRNYLLNSGSLTTVNDMSVLQNILHLIQSAMVEAGLETTREMPVFPGIEALIHLDWAAKFEISAWVRSEAGRLSQYIMVETPGKPPLPGSKLFTLNHFLIMRSVLEALGDVAVLADVLHLVSSTKQESILAAMVDTIHYNARTFSAIGALAHLQRTFGQAYVNLRGVKPCILSFATALLDLCIHFPCQITPIRALQQDLIRGDRGRALAACSPFSDGIAESLQQAGVTFPDDFEAILLGEPNMSEQTMTSLFTVLVGRIMKSDGDLYGQNTFALCQLLARLRLFRPTQGDALIHKWLSRLFSAAWSQLHRSIMLHLLRARCIEVEELLDLSNQAPTASKCREGVRNVIASGLLPSDLSSDLSQALYVNKIAAFWLRMKNPARALDLLLVQNDAESALLDVCAEILPAVLSDPKEVSSLSVTAAKSLPVIVDKLLDVTMLDNNNALARIMARVSWLSLPFCSFRIPGHSGSVSNDSSDVAEAKALQVYTGLRLHEEAHHQQPQITQALFTAMPQGIQDRVRAMAEHHFYESMPKVLEAKLFNRPFVFTPEERSSSVNTMKKYLSLGFAQSTTGSSDSNGMLIEKLSVVAKVLGARMEPQPSSSTSALPSSRLSPACASLQSALPALHRDSQHRDNMLGVLECVGLLLRMTSMKLALFGGVNGVPLSKTSTNEQIKLIAFLASIATQPLLAQILVSNCDEHLKGVSRDCTTFALDIAARLADDLTEEARMACARILKDRLRDERIMWLIGSMTSWNALHNTAGQGLVMMHETKGNMGDFRPKQWEMLESGGGKDNDTCLGVGLFGAKRIS